VLWHHFVCVIIKQDCGSGCIGALQFPRTV